MDDRSLGALGEDDRAFHTHWLQVWKLEWRIGLMVLAFNAGMGAFAFIWATLHFPGLWWLYIIVAVNAAAMLVVLRVVRAAGKRITQERSALERLGARATAARWEPTMRTEVRAFAPGDFDTERARAIQDAFRTGHIITGHVRADGARDRDDHAE